MNEGELRALQVGDKLANAQGHKAEVVELKESRGNLVAVIIRWEGTANNWPLYASGTTWFQLDVVANDHGDQVAASEPT